MKKDGLEGLNGFGMLRFLAIEKMAERKALRTMYGSGHTDCFRINHIKPQIVQVDGDGEPLKQKVLSQDKKGNEIEIEEVEVILEGHTIPNAVNRAKFLKSLQQPTPIWFTSVDEDGNIIPDGNKNDHVEKLRKWEWNDRGGANRLKMQKIHHPKQIKVMDRWIEYAVDHWIMLTKLEKMAIEGWGFADEYVHQEIMRNENFKKRKLPELYKAIHESLSRGIQPILRPAITIIIKDALLEAPDGKLTPEQAELIADKISEKVVLDDVLNENAAKQIADSVVEGIAENAHEIFLIEKRTSSPGLIETPDEPRIITEKAS